MRIQFDLFHPTGKWAYGGEVEIGERRMWDVDFIPAIIANQREVVQTAFDDQYVMVTDDIPANKQDPDFRGFTKGFFPVQVLTAGYHRFLRLKAEGKL